MHERLCILFLMRPVWVKQNRGVRRETGPRCFFRTVRCCPLSGLFFLYSLSSPTMWPSVLLKKREVRVSQRIALLKNEFTSI